MCEAIPFTSSTNWNYILKEMRFKAHLQLNFTEFLKDFIYLWSLQKALKGFELKDKSVVA